MECTVDLKYVSRDVVVTLVPDAETTMVSIESKGHIFFKASVNNDIVQSWKDEDAVAARAMELLLQSHPLNYLAFDLRDVLPEIAKLAGTKELQRFVAVSAVVLGVSLESEPLK